MVGLRGHGGCSNFSVKNWAWTWDNLQVEGGQGTPTSGRSHQLTKVSWISHLTACNWGVQGADSLPHSLGIASWYFAN